MEGREGSIWPADALVVSEELGEFALADLVAGRWWLGVWDEGAGSWASELVGVEVRPSGQHSGLVLQAADSRPLPGRVTVAGRGVAGAAVWVLFPLAHGAVSATNSKVAKGDGRFVVRLPTPAALPRLNVVVCVPRGIPASARFAWGEALQVHLPAARDILGLRPPAGARIPRSNLLLVSEAGVPFPLGWAMGCGRAAGEAGGYGLRRPCRPGEGGAGGQP